MSFFSRVEAIAVGIAHSAHGFFVKLFGQQAVDNFDNDIKSVLREDVMVIFKDAILAAETLKTGEAAATGGEKRAAAFEQIVKDLATNGISLSNHIINLGIELVVGLLKGSSAPASTGASAT